MPIQDHIHLDVTLSGAPEFAPVATYKAQDWQPYYSGDVDIARGATGKLFFNTYTDDSGNPIVFDDRDLQLFVTTAELTALRALVHKSVYYVEPIHPNDASSHTTYVRTMILGTLKYIRKFSTQLDKHIVAISLIDDDTVT